MTNKIFKALCIMILIIALGVTVFASDIAPIAEKQYPEFTSSYETTYIYGWDYGEAVRGYQIGGLFNLWKSRAFTEANGEISLPISAHVAYAYAKIVNLNDGEEESSSNSVVDSQRCTTAYTDYISSDYATSIHHISSLKVNGETQWTTSEGTYNKQ